MAETTTTDAGNKRLLEEEQLKNKKQDPKKGNSRVRKHLAPANGTRTGAIRKLWEGNGEAMQRRGAGRMNRSWAHALANGQIMK